MMDKKILILVMSMLFSIIARSQFGIGHVQINFTDASRNDRSIGCEVYYPALSVGENTSIELGTFPQIIFGHGFLMAYSAYANIWENLVPQGYVMVFVTTEGGIAPNHDDYGLDLAFVLNSFYTFNTDLASIFENHLSDRQAIAGHSMGGGSAWLAAQNNSSVECVIGLAPAETNSSSITAAESVTADVLILSGSSDNVTPPAENHQLIYDASASSCKYFVSIENGSHCGFANSGSLCDIGEFGFSGISREEQQAFTHALLSPWLRWQLYQEPAGQAEFIVVAEGEGLQLSSDCVVSIEESSADGNSFIWPTLCLDDLRVNSFTKNAPSHIVIYDLYGSRIMAFSMNGGSQLIQLDALSAGTYLLVQSTSNEVRKELFMKQ